MRCQRVHYFCWGPLWGEVLLLPASTRHTSAWKNELGAATFAGGMFGKAVRWTINR